jgi:CP family cyanate transporter-like MFS transporter
VPLGVGIALIGLSLPSVIKRTFAVRVGAGTGVYVAAQALGSAIVALTMVPLSQALGGWRAAFAVSALPTVVALPLWLLLPTERSSAITDGSGARVGGSEATRPLRLPSSRGLLLAAAFGLQSMCYAGMINWLATVCIHTGFSPGDAGLATATVAILGVPAALIVPALSDGRDRGRWLLGTAVVMGVGIAGLAFTPANAPWLWIVTFSLGAGAVFPLVLTLPLDLGRTTHDVTELTSWMLGYGYFLSATGPLLVGGLYGLTGGFLMPLALLALLGTSSGVVALTPALRSRAPQVATASAGVIV